MAAAIGLRDDYDAGALRAAAKRSKDGPQARRQLALAAIYDGATRTEAAKIGGVGLQVVRDWVMKFNADGPEGLIDRKAPGQPPRLNDGHHAALAAILESGPIPAVHGWCAGGLLISANRFSRNFVSSSPSRLSAARCARWVIASSRAAPVIQLRTSGPSRLSKNVWAAPSARDYSRAPMIGLLQPIRLGRTPPSQDADRRARVLINFPASDHAVF